MHHLRNLSNPNRRAFLSLLLIVLLSCLHWSCDKPKATENPLDLTGTGEYSFSDYLPFANKPIRCFYHIPSNSSSTTPIFIVVHGAGREAKDLRDGLIAKANQKGFIVLSPEFSESFFPGSDAFNLANIFEDGDNPSPNTLNPPSEWTFSVLDILFEDFKSIIGNISSQYDVFGHSAGAQMIHRFLIFNPEAKFNRLISSAAGWYALPNLQVDYPYGLNKSPAESIDPQLYFQRNAYIIVGSEDTDPNSFNLRHTAEADLQGNNRLQRAQYFFQESFRLANEGSFNYQWQYRLVNNVGHDAVALAIYSADLLY